MVRPHIDDVLPLTPLQEGLLFHALYDKRALDVYNVQFALRLEGALDVPALRNACAGLLRRHGNLRVAFRSLRDGRPVQVVPSAVPLPWEEADLTGRLYGALRDDAPELASKGIRAIFDAPTPRELARLAVRRCAPTGTG
jgi:hypothetical protein